MNECYNQPFWPWQGWDDICKEILWDLSLERCPLVPCSGEKISERKLQGR